MGSALRKKQQKQKEKEEGEAAAAAAAASGVVEAPAKKKHSKAEIAEFHAAADARKAKKEKAKLEAAATDEVADERKKANKRKREEEAEAEAEEQPAAGEEGEEAKKPGRKANKRARQAALKELGGEEQTEEATRREAQKELQQLILRLRKEGKTEAEIKKAKMDLRTQKEMAPMSGKETKKKEWMEWMESDKSERKNNLEHKHDLVIIPIAWRGRHDKDDVDKAAEDIKACVAQQKIDVWIDSRRQLTPGEKFGHWEQRGCMLRIEVGPEDLKKGECRVCLAKTPNDHKSVVRKNVRMPPAGARKLLLLLKEWGLSKIEIEKREGDDDSDDDVVNRVEATKAGDAEQDDDDLAGNYAPRDNKEKTKSQKRR